LSALPMLLRCQCPDGDVVTHRRIHIGIRCGTVHDSKEVHASSNRISSVVREPKSHLDRHAIGVAGRVLTTGIWWSFNSRVTARRGAVSIEGPSWLEPPAVSRISVSKINQPRNEEAIGIHAQLSPLLAVAAAVAGGAAGSRYRPRSTTNAFGHALIGCDAVLHNARSSRPHDAGVLDRNHHPYGEAAVGGATETIS